MKKLFFLSAFVAGAGMYGCSGGSSTPLSAGPIVTQTDLTSTSSTASVPLAPGQSITVVFRETTCRYQQYTSQASRGQYRSLGCDAPRIPSSLLVTVAPLHGTSVPCAATAQITAPGTVVATKTGPGDPFDGAPPYNFCLIYVTDPAIGGTPAVVYV